MSYAEPKTYEALERAIASARADGSASLTVPMFGGSSGAFDDAVAGGLALRYRVLIEMDLPQGKGQRS